MPKQDNLPEDFQLFNPDLKDMDNFYEYLSDLEFKTGICKIIPPKDWIPSIKNLFDISLSKYINQNWMKIDSNMYQVFEEEVNNDEFNFEQFYSTTNEEVY